MLALGLVASLSSGTFAVVPPSTPALPDLDRRAPASGPTPAQLQSVVRLQQQDPHLVVAFDPILAVPAHIACREGCLPGGDGAGGGVVPRPPLEALGAFLEQHQDLFGHGSELMGTVRLQTDYRTRHNGLRTCVWQQETDGIPVWGARLTAHFASDDRLVAVSSHCLPTLPAGGGGPIEPALAAEAALRAGIAHLTGVAAAELAEMEAQNPGWRCFGGPELNGVAYARLVWLPTGAGALRLCWELILTPSRRPEMYRVLLDAEQVWLRQCLTDHATPASYRVFTSDSPRPFSPGHAIPLTNEPALVERELVTLSALDSEASPEGWIHKDENWTRGNNVHAHLDRDNNDQPDLPIPEGSPSRVFDFSMEHNTAPLTYGHASVAQLFYWNNWMHDRLYGLGFNEQSGNFQLNNFGRGGLGGDPVQADAQNGGETDNANFSTPPDGLPPRMQMYIWSGPHPDRDAAFDVEVVLHEYAHGLTHRLVGGAAGLTALQSRGLGEGWSDFYALALLSEEADDPDGNYALGAYLAQRAGANSQHYYFGLRRYPYTTDLSKNPLTFRDLDPVQARVHAGIPRNPVASPFANQIHNMGEVWCVALWEARALLIYKHGFSAGNELMLQIVTDALRLTPSNPTYLQARDAILLAERLLTHGENREQLWTAFAKRGLGFSAQSPPSHTTSGIGEAFDLPDAIVIRPLLSQQTRGEVGGPFSPNSFTFTLSNSEPDTVGWAAGVDSPWARLSPSSGQLGSDVQELRAELTAAARLLPPGIHLATLSVTNLANGRVQHRKLRLDVGQRPSYTEWFDSGDNDLDYQSFTFTPDNQGYTVCRTTIQELPTDPAGGTPLPLNDEGLADIVLSGGRQIVFFGRPYAKVTAASNGFLTFGEVEQARNESIEAHFRRTRLSALFDDLDPSAGGMVSWKQLPDRLTITYLDVPESFAANKNTFQIDLFFDGALRLSYLQIDAIDGLVGLSPGAGVPEGFMETDYSSLPNCAVLLRVRLPETVMEGDRASSAFVEIAEPADSNIVVRLLSDWPEQLQVPREVTIPAGLRQAAWTLEPIDDLLFDGPQRVRITAHAPGYLEASGTLMVHDNETANVHLHIPARAAEGDTNLTGSILFSVAPEDYLMVEVQAEPPAEARVPALVIVPPGQRSVVFQFDLVDNNLIEAERTLLLSVRVPGGPSAQGLIVIEDNESRQLLVTLPHDLREGWGEVQGAGNIALGGILPTNLVIALNSDRPDKLLPPVTLLMPAGQSALAFPITLPENETLEGDQTVTVEASAPGFTSGHAHVVVSDNEIPLEPGLPSPPNMATNVPANTILSWELFDVGTPQPATFEVYLSQMPSLAPSNLVATTGQHQWSPPLLEPLTTYYWQVVARRAASTAGPVWQFTTRGLDHFRFSSIPSPQTPRRPFPLTLTARDAFGSLVNRFEGDLLLSALGPAGPGASRILISEVESGDPDYVEFTNVSPLPINLGGWLVTIYDQISWPEPLVTVQLPAGFCPPGVAFRLRELGQPPGAFPNFSAGASIRWLQELTNNPIAILLQEPDRRIADFVCAGTADPMAIANPLVIPWAQWQGSALPVNQDTDINYQRVGAVDRNSANDWTLATANAGLVNPGLMLPFTDRRLLTITPTNLFMTTGQWTGEISLLEPAAAAQVIVSDGNRQDASTVFAVTLSNDLALSSRSAPDPVAIGGELDFHLSVSNSGPARATGVVLANILPPHTTLLEVSAPTPPSTNGALLGFSLGALEPDQTVDIRLRVRPNAPGALTNRAFVSRLEPDVYPENNMSAAVASVRWPLLSIDDATIPEGDNGTSLASFSVRLSLPTGLAVQCEVFTVDGTARAGEDYIELVSVVTFAPYQTNTIVTVPILGDRVYEPNETFSVRLRNPLHAALARSRATGTILDNEARPTLVAHDISLLEGRAGFTPALFLVELTTAHSQTVSVHYATEPGTATPEQDYLPVSGTLILAPGVTSTNVAVPVRGDRLAEGHESFQLVLSASNNAEITRARATATILNDDGYPGQVDRLTWQVSHGPHHANFPFQATLTALDSFGQPAAAFREPVRLLALRDAPRTVRLLSWVGHANLGSDSAYASTLSAIRAFFADFTNATTVQTDPTLLDALLRQVDVFLIPAQDRAEIGLLGPLGASWREPLTNFVHRGGILIVCSLAKDEHVILSRSGLLQADKFGSIQSSLADASAPHPLLDAVPLPFEPPALGRYVNHNATVLLEHNRFPGVLSRATGAGIALLIGSDFRDRRTSLDRLLANAVHQPQIGQREVLPLSPQTASPFVDGHWSGDLLAGVPGPGIYLLATNDSGLFALTEPLALRLRDDLAVQLAGSGDPAALGSPLTYTMVVTNSGPATAFSVLLSNALPAAASPLRWTTSQGTCRLAGNGIQCDLGVIHAFAHAIVTVEMLPTRVAVLTNVVSVSHQGPDSYPLNNTALLTTLVQEAAWSIDSVSLLEGNEGFSIARLPVRLFPPIAHPAHVHFQTCELSASAPPDFLATNGVVQFIPGQSVAFVDVLVRGDWLLEPDETFCVRLSQPSFGVLKNPDAVVTILNDDLPSARLHIERQGDQIMMAWPAAPGNVALEQSDTLDETGTWRRVLDTPTVQETTYYLTLPMSATNSYFRLVPSP